ncbi:dephospho-CoA kinase [Candidatus Peregrinibacteria bacterium]|nr:dephospho-CoA kinase [Candidatus Peregrinibacteria bacterium]
MIIGLTGSMGSGKGEVVNILKSMGYEYITLSTMVREEAQRQGIKEERTKLMEIGNNMRKQEGAGVLAQRALKKISDSKHENWVIDGIRNPAEIEELKKGDGVNVIAVYADKEILIERILERDRASDPKSRMDIANKIDREWGFGEPEEGQQVGKCIEMADQVLKNEGTLEDLNRQFMAYYGQLIHDDFKRPSKDEYYLNLAQSVCRRSTCTKVEIGAVIIRNDQVVATGYCGAPRGTKSSHQHGFCLRKSLGIPSGHRYEMCRSVHAEQNAIINAARAGTSLLGGDMYIYGKVYAKDEVIDAFPCFICKKMLINCGLKRVICSLKDGGFKIFMVEDWVNDWHEHDIIDDKFQYGVKSYK